MLKIIVFDDWDDEDLINQAVSERLRYIGSGFEFTLGDTSYWIDNAYGSPLLSSTFQNYVDKLGLTPKSYSGSIVNDTPDKSDRTINITVNDYSD